MRFSLISLERKREREEEVGGWLGAKEGGGAARAPAATVIMVFFREKSRVRKEVWGTYWGVAGMVETVVGSGGRDAMAVGKGGIPQILRKI